MLGRRKGLSFTRRRKRIETSAIQAGLFWAGECILAFAIGCVLVFYFMSRLTCVGQAMEPSINSGNSVLVNRFSYAMTTPKRGDVIGVPGDKIQVKDGFVYVNGDLYETGIGNEQMDYAGLAEEELKVGSDEYFVLGDNRNVSEDSRSADIGNVKKSDIYGKAWFVAYPWDNFGFVTSVK